MTVVPGNIPYLSVGTESVGFEFGALGSRFRVWGLRVSGQEEVSEYDRI